MLKRSVRTPAAWALLAAALLLLAAVPYTGLRSDGSVSVNNLVLRPAPHPLLRKLLVCASFHYNVEKLVYLKQILTVTGSYPTDVGICIVTDAPDKLRLAFDHWGFPAGWVCGTDNELPADEKYALLWEHRGVIANVASEGYTTVLYIEDDTYVSWEALQSWAADTEVLEPLGFIRGFYRTEVQAASGQVCMLDTFGSHLSLKKAAIVKAEVAPEKRCSVGNPADGFWAWKEVPKLCSHTHYLAPSSPYYGAWIATASQLQRFQQTRFWTKEGSLATHIQQNNASKPWGYPEKTTAGMLFVDVPLGLWSRSVLPFDATLQSLLPSSQISHERHGYQMWLKVRPQDYII